MADINEELIKEAGKVIGENVGNITLPTSKSIGDNVGLLVDGVFGWLGLWGQKQKIKQQINIEKFKQKINQGIQDIPADRLIEPKINIVGPAVESAKYYFEEEYYKDMFAKLIIESCDKEKNGIIHPSFIETIKQLSPLDAKIVTLFNNSQTYAAARLIAENKDNTITSSTLILCDFKGKNYIFDEDEKIFISRSIENLMRLGLITMNSSILELGYNYNNFEKYTQYKDFEKVIEEGAEIRIKKYRLEPTSYGRSFFEICI